MQNIKTIPQLAVQNLPADLESKADADEVVLLTGNQTVEGNKNLTETPVIQLWNADINPTANQTIVFSINSVGTFELYKNKTGINGSNPPAQDGTNWEFISTCQGSRAYVQEFAPSESPVSSITLTEGVCYNADFMTVAVDHTILDPSAYTLGINGTTITFAEPVEAGLTITVRWFTEMNLSNVYRQPLLSCFWSDHLIYELSYLCADPFSWQDGNVYSAAYNHLVADIEGKSIITEGLITYYQADDGHKIATAVSHDAVANLYDETGVSWYYILDVENHRFKLPRTKYAFSGWRGDVGEYIPESLPNITGSLAFRGSAIESATAYEGAFAPVASTGRTTTSLSTTGSGPTYTGRFDASRSSAAYQTDAPVQQRGTQMYLYFYVGNYTPQAIEQTAGYAQTLTELKADKDLANSPYTTNRILEIPQDINLELNDGILTRKTGCKFYIPNGFEEDGTTPKFDTVISTQDYSSKPISGGGTGNVLVLNPNLQTDFPRIHTSHCFSGSTAPSDYSTMLWYDTTNNLMKITTNSGSTWSSGYSFPYAITTVTNDVGVTSIDQVFNGFGYIGSTVFALPGVKVQIPDGRNEDGTCKSVAWSVPNVQTITYTNQTTNLLGFVYSSGFNMTQHPPIDYMGKKPTSGACMWFDTMENVFYYSSDWSDPSKAVKLNTIACCEYHISSGKITSFTPYSVDSVSNNNMTNLSAQGRSYLSGLGMPSSRYIDLTLGASGTDYTAPVNGYVSLQMTSSSASQSFCSLTNMTAGSMVVRCFAYAANAPLRVILPIRKGDIFEPTYANATNVMFRFIYAEGEN